MEYFGGRLGTLDYPMHGKPSEIRWRGGRLLGGLPERFSAGRYHSLFGERESLPACLEVTAETEDGVIMAIEHRTLPVAAVQFHPESILTLGDEVGRRLIHEVVERLLPPAAAPRPTRRRLTAARCSSPEERAQRRAHGLHRLRRVPAPHRGDERHHVGGVEAQGVDPSRFTLPNDPLRLPPVPGTTPAPRPGARPAPALPGRVERPR